MKPTVYIETTVVSYLTSWPSRNVLRLSHEITTRDWWAQERSRFQLFVSDVVLNEASEGDPVAAAERLNALSGITILPMNDHVFALAEQLASGLQLTQRARPDAFHIAISAVHEISYLLTWNCRHLANAVLAGKINQICQSAQRVAPRIITPDLLMKPI